MDELSNLFNNTIELGRDCNQELKRQNDILETSVFESRDLNENLDFAKSKIEGMESVWSWLWNWFTPTLVRNVNNPNQPNQQIQPIRSTQQTATKPPKQSENIDGLLHSVYELKKISLEMTKELDESKDLIDKVEVLTVKNEIKMKNLKGRVEAIS